MCCFRKTRSSMKVGERVELRDWEEPEIVAAVEFRAWESVSVELFVETGNRLGSGMVWAADVVSVDF